jgi:hypothetical protein
MNESSSERRVDGAGGEERESAREPEAPEPKRVSGESAEGEEGEAEEQEPSPPPKKAQASEGASAKAKPAAQKQRPQGSLFSPTNVAVMAAAAGLLAFWKGSAIYGESGRDFYSASAWLFLVAFFLVTVSALHFLGPKLRQALEPEAPRSPETDAADARRPGGDAAAAPQQKRPSAFETVIPAFPAFALYAVLWWVIWDVWNKVYPRFVWAYFPALALVTYGAYRALRPPSESEERAATMPTRRVMLLIMLPFVVVYGMIWLASIK